ncbi:MAG: hypothetical protein ACYC0O_11455 [Desulfurivibrionaceae bacterium]
MKGGEKNVRDLELANRLLDSFSRIAGVINAPRLDYPRRLGRILAVILEYLGVEQGSLMVLERKKYRLFSKICGLILAQGACQPYDTGRFSAHQSS